MFEAFDKMMMAGLGALSMSREKAEKMFDEYVKRGEVEKEKKEGFISDMLEYAEKNRKEMEEMVGRQMHKTMSNLDIPTKADLDRLEKKIDQLIKNSSSK